MEENQEEITIIKEQEFTLISEKKIEYKLNLFISSNELLCINVFTINNNQNKKYSLSLTMNDLIKNRFFKIFYDLDEIFRELENKIEKSIIIEESNFIYLDIPIGLIVISDVILKIEETEKSKDDFIKELNDDIYKKDKIINENNIKIQKLETKLKENEINFNLQKENLNNEIQILNQKIEKNNVEKNKIDNLISNINELKSEIEKIKVENKLKKIIKYSPILENGWIVDPNIPQEFIVVKNNENQVSFQGAVVGDWSKKIFTLKKEFRTKYRLCFPVIANQAFNRIDILPNGDVYLSYHASLGVKGNGWVAFSGITYYISE